MQHYWIRFICTTVTDHDIPFVEVTTEHPFTRAAFWDKFIEGGSSRTYKAVEMVNWKEITQKEADLFNSLKSE